MLRVTPGHVVLFFCCLTLLVIQPLSSAQTASGESSKEAFATDLGSARQGDIEAQLRVARAYNKGVIVNRNYAEALRWFQEASRQGSIEATAWLGSMYLLGHGVAEDMDKATSLLQQAVNKNNPVGLRFMALKYERGDATNLNYSSFAKAAELYSKAVNQGDVQSYERLGHLYLEGIGVPKDVHKAFELFTTGAQLGEPWAELALGRMYEEDLVDAPAHSVDEKSRSARLSINLQRARELFSASADQGNSSAAYMLGKIYDLGIGTPQNYVLAFQYYKQSANDRHVPALTALGQMYALGHGTVLSLPDSYVVYSLANEYSHGRSKDAVLGLQEIKRRLSPDQLQQAEAMLKAERDLEVNSATKLFR